MFSSHSCRGWQFCKSKENMMIKDLVDQKCNKLRKSSFSPKWSKENYIWSHPKMSLYEYIKTIETTRNLVLDSIIQFINFRHCHPFSLFKDQLYEICISSKLWGGMHQAFMEDYQHVLVFSSSDLSVAARIDSWSVYWRLPVPTRFSDFHDTDLSVAACIDTWHFYNTVFAPYKQCCYSVQII